MRRWAEAGLAIVVLMAALLGPGRVSEHTAVIRDARPVEEFRLAPVRVHLLRSPDVMAIDTRLTTVDIERIFRKVNGIWHAAGLHLWVESVVEEKPGRVTIHQDDRVVPSSALLPLRRADSRPEGMFHVYYVGAMDVNGRFIDRDAIFVQEAAMLVKVPGGIDEPLPRVTAHELGHAFGLPHRQDRTNLMASGTTGTGLNKEEIHTARRTAESISWIETPDAFLKKAEELAAAGRKEEAARRYHALLALPGPSPLKDRTKDGIRPLRGPGRGSGARLPRIPLLFQHRRRDVSAHADGIVTAPRAQYPEEALGFVLGLRFLVKAIYSVI